MSLPGLDTLHDLAGATVLLRLDLNVPIGDGRVLDGTRIEAAVPTLRWLTERAGVVTACSHLGKAKGAFDPAFSLAPVAAELERALGRPVMFLDDCLDATAGSAAPGSLLLLENLRFHPGEKANDPEFVRRLVAPYSHYVNDAFGTAHRSHASVVGVPELYGSGRKAAGFLMGAEVSALRRMVVDPDPPYLAAVGGAKVSTKTAPLEALADRVQTLLIGGGMANTFLLAMGREVGQSLVEPDMVDTARQVMERARDRGVTLELPTDVVVTDSVDSPSTIEVVGADAVPRDRAIVDLGPASRARYREAVLGARTVFWNGPMGVFESEPFAEGTMALARAMAESDAFTVVGGGESVMAVHRAGLADRIDHVSTGGGASLAFLTGEVLPAVRALEG